jgi:hypothetical protein
MQSNSNTPTPTGGPAATLLNWSTPFDQQKVQILDQVVAGMYSGIKSDMEYANQILNEFKSHENAWHGVD